MTTIITLVTAAGVLTTYAGQYVGEPLYCGDIYRDDLAFIALPVGEFESGRAICGDLVQVTVGEHVFYAQALDAGPLEKYRVEQFGDLPIVADVPAHLWPLDWEISGLGGVFNVSAFNRMCPDCAMGVLR